MLNSCKDKSCFVGILILVSLIFHTSFSNAETATNRVVDRLTGSSVPFATVVVVGTNVGTLANEDGVFTISAEKGQQLRISQVGYSSITISYEQLIQLNSIDMEELPVEISPVIITADAARRDIVRAIDSTYKLLKEPIFLTCYQQDRVELNAQAVVEARAIIAAKIRAIFDPSKGNSASYDIVGLSVTRNPDFPVDTVSKFRFLPVAYVNSFLVGASKKDDRNLIYSYLNVSDSIVVISYRPKSSFVPSGLYLLTSGRIFIDNATWRILRIDSELNNTMLDYQRQVAESNKKVKEKYYSYATSTSYSKGIPVRVKRLLTYSMKGDPSNTQWTNTSDQVFVECTAMSSSQEKRVKLNKSKALIFQKSSSVNTEFEAKFNEGFKKE